MTGLIMARRAKKGIKGLVWLEEMQLGCAALAMGIKTNYWSGACLVAPSISIDRRRHIGEPWLASKFSTSNFVIQAQRHWLPGEPRMG
jgi:hypothetical protein